jgi:hypothetical protein
LEYSFDSSYYSHTLGSSSITINKTGRYKILSGVSILRASGNPSDYRAVVGIDSGTGFVTALGSDAYLTLSNSNIQGTFSVRGSFLLNAGDLVNISVQRLSGGGTATTIVDSSNVIITYLKS